MDSFKNTYVRTYYYCVQIGFYRVYRGVIGSTIVVNNRERI